MKPVIVMLAAHEPERDPRVIWEARYAGSGFDVILVGLANWQARATTSERRPGHRLVRVPRLPSLRTKAALLGAVARSMLPAWVLVGCVLASFALVPLLLLAHLICVLSQTRSAGLASAMNGSLTSALARGAFRAAPKGRMRRFLSSVVWHWSTCSGLFAALRALPRRPDVVHCNDLETLLVGILARRVLGCRVVLDDHEFWPHSDADAAGWEVSLLLSYERWLIQDADRVFTVNPLLAHEIQKAYGVEVGSVPNAAPLALTTAPRPLARPRASGPVTFLFQGNFASQRGLEEVIRAWRHIDPALGTLLLRGTDNEWKAACVALARDLGLLDRGVSFPPPVTEDELVEAAAEADVGIIPYKPICLNYAFCCPNKLSQYLQAGIPILACATAYVRSVLEESEAGVCYEPGDEPSLVAAVSRLLGDDGLRSRLGENGIRFARERFHWQAVSAPLYEAYRVLSGELSRGDTESQ